MSESLFNQPVACYPTTFFNKKLPHRRLLVVIPKQSRIQFLQEHPETPDSVFTEHICNYNTIKFNVNWSKLENLNFFKYFRKYKIRKNHSFRRCIDVATTLLHRRRFTDVFKTS